MNEKLCCKCHEAPRASACASYCRECQRVYARTYQRVYLRDYRAGQRRRPPKPALAAHEKYCPHCRSALDKTAFARNRSTADGLDSWCRECHADATNALRARQKRARFVAAGALVRRARGTGT